MKRIFFYWAALFLGFVAFSGCDEVEVGGIPITGVTLEPSALTLPLGVQAALTATVQPGNAKNKKVIWESNNHAVATVNSNGLVTAMAVGNATITVRTATGNKTANCVVTVVGTGSFFSGNGTASNPYLIGSPEDLMMFANVVNAGALGSGVYYKLSDNINLAVYGTNLNAGEGWRPIGDAYGFTGNFDGGGFAVLGLYMNSSNLTYAGLFGRVHGKVTNLAVINANVSGANYAGAIAGYVGSEGSITNCYVTGTVKGAQWVGGVAGFVAFNGTVRDCYATCAVSGIQSVGGVAGGVDKDGMLTNCAALNPTITRNTGSQQTIFGRVAGSGNLSNNVAWSGMQAINITFPTGNGSDHVNGRPVDAPEVKTATFWTTTTSTWTGWHPDVWDVANNRLPILKGADGNQLNGNPPAHLL